MQPGTVYYFEIPENPVDHVWHHEGTRLGGHGSIQAQGVTRQDLFQIAERGSCRRAASSQRVNMLPTIGRAERCRIFPEIGTSEVLR